MKSKLKSKLSNFYKESATIGFYLKYNVELYLKCYNLMSRFLKSESQFKVKDISHYYIFKYNSTYFLK